MQTQQVVRTLAAGLNVWETFVAGVSLRLDPQGATELIARLAVLPVRSSSAAGLLGSYAHRGGEPLCIRLQTHQETELLRTTLLHELAHACEHLTADRPRQHRCNHGAAWQAWALAFGIPPRRSAKSVALNALRRQRLKPVAICERCGCVFHRLRRLPARRSWLHPDCGNGRVVPIAADREKKG